MKVCPECSREYEDIYNFCLKDGTPLGSSESPPETDGDGEQETVIRRHGSGEGGAAETFVMPNATDPAAADAPTGGDAGATDPGGSPEYVGEENPPEPAATEEIPYEPADAEEERTAVVPPPVEAARVQIEQDPPAAPAETPQGSGRSRAYIGIILGLLAIFGVLLIGAAAAGIWLYMQSQQAYVERASANTNADDANDAPDEENTGLESPTGEDPGNAGDTDDTTGTEDDEDAAADNEDRTAEEKRREEEKKKTPTPTPGRTPERATPTPRADRDRVPDADDPPPPPPPVPPTPPAGPKRISGGVLNGKAISLPKPAYPAAARAANIRGSVNVSVVIDERGRVISANAVSGHPLLRGPAVSAARRARFTPTLLSGRPVEVSGVIVYNFQ